MTGVGMVLLIRMLTVSEIIRGRVDTMRSLYPLPETPAGSVHKMAPPDVAASVPIVVGDAKRPALLESCTLWIFPCRMAPLAVTYALMENVSLILFGRQF